jgi:hypothetical protein
MKKVLVLLSFLCLASTYPPTTSKDSTDTTNVVTFNYQFPNFTGTHTGVTFSLGVLGVAGGGTGLSSPGAAGTVLSSNGSVASWIYPPLTSTQYTVTTATNCTTGGIVLAGGSQPAGTYLVIASANISAASTAGNTLTFNLLINSVYTASGIRTATPIDSGIGGTFQAMSISTNGLITLPATQNIQIACFTSSGTITLNYVTLDIVRIQ